MRNFKQQKQFMTIEGRKDSGVPERPQISTDSYTFQFKAFSDLKYGLIATKADPQTTATTSSQPYAIIGRTNKVLGGYYPGSSNLSGNVLNQLMISNSSKLVNCFDSGNMTIKLNYLFLNLENKTNPHAVNKYMGVTINEALSRTNAEMTTQLPFATYQIEAPNLPQADLGNKLYLMALYQGVLQNTASVLAKYLQLMSLEKTLIDMGFNREANFTMELFGQLKKAALVAKFQALATTLFGEYFDTDWYKQVNTLTMIPSRKSDSVRDPLLTIVATHKLPTITVKSSGGTKLFETADFSVRVQRPGLDKTYTQDALCEKVISMLDQRNILEWARKNYSGVGSNQTAVAYYNELITYIDAISQSMAKFSNVMSDVRTYLDVTGKIGLNQWKIGTRFDMRAVPSSPICFNKILNDVFAAYLGSPEEVNFSELTQRWTMFTIWNEFTGIPDYDQYTGGAFLAFSLRTVVPGTLPLDDSRLLVPILFSVKDDSVKFTARTGLTANFNYKTYTASQLKDDDILSRLAPLASMEVKTRVPYVDLTSIGNTPGAQSAAFEIMQTVFGFGSMKISATKTNIALSRDVVSFLDIQIADVNNDMLTYIRSFAPFRVWTLSGARTIGFGRE